MIMKRTIIFLGLLTFVVLTGWTQENMATITGGYAFANMEGTDTNASGFRVNGVYEFNPNGGKLSHGLSIGYIGTSADSTGIQGAEFKLNSWPIYYAPKLMFGKGKFKFYVKGALGIHFSSYKRIAEATETTTTDMGFYGGASVGAMIFVKENIFLNAEYEWAYLSNSFYTDGFINTANFGLGFKF